MNEETKAGIDVTYSGVEIHYNEHANQWEFILRGRERVSDSLKSAKSAIDTPPDPKKEGPAFDRIQAYYRDYRDWNVVTVTSQVRGGYYSDHYRYRSPKGRGTNTAAGKNLYPVTPENTAKIEEVKALGVKIDELRHQADAIVGTLLTVSKLDGDRQKEARAAAEAKEEKSA